MKRTTSMYCYYYETFCRHRRLSNFPIPDKSVLKSVYVALPQTYMKNSIIFILFINIISFWSRIGRLLTVHHPAYWILGNVYWCFNIWLNWKLSLTHQCVCYFKIFCMYEPKLVWIFFSFIKLYCLVNLCRSCHKGYCWE